MHSVAICVNVDINADQLCIEKDVTYLVPGLHNNIHTFVSTESSGIARYKMSAR